MPSDHSKLLLHVIEGINRTVELQELLKKCMEAARIVMNTEASSLMLIDEQTGELNVSIPTGPVEDEITGITIPKEKGIGGWVFEHNEPYYTNDIQKSRIFWKDLSDSFTTRNIICVPLRDSDQESFGVIQAINRVDDEPFTKEDLTVFEALAMHVSIAISRARKYEKMMNQLEDREVQLTEIHHRLKNNLATICALIELDISDLEEEKSKAALKVTGSRIRSVSDVHALLYDQKNLGELELGNYLKSVAKNIRHIFADPDKEIVIHTDFDEVYVDANKSMITGLIINELLINAYQHAFEGKQSGEITLRLFEEKGDKVRVVVTDDGIGGNHTDDESGKKTYGTFIIKALTRKIQGDLSSEDSESGGMKFELSFNR